MHKQKYLHDWSQYVKFFERVMEFKHIVFDHDGTLVNPEDKKLFSGMHELLEKLISRGAKLYVWTARGRSSTIEILKNEGVVQLFEDIFTSTDGELKPSIQGLNYMLDGISKEEILIIGDSYTDMIGAKNFKVSGIGANWLQQCEDNLEVLNHFGAKVVFNNLIELQKYLIK